MQVVDAVLVNPARSKEFLNISADNKTRHLLKLVLNTFAAKHLKNQYLSAKHVSRTPEYGGYMGSTQNISSTIQHIAVKLSQNVSHI